MNRITWLLLAVALSGCMKLDAFLFSPTPAGPNDNLMAMATAIPPSLVTELKSEITTADGVAVDAYLLSHSLTDGTLPAHHTTAVLYNHGNADNIAHYAVRAQALWSLGYTVLLYDYRGFGKTHGTPSETGVYADGRAARAYLEGPAGFAGHVAMYGWSLGAAVATQLAVETPTPALILEAPFASVAELITDSSALDAPRPWFADAQFDNRGKIPGFSGDLLVMHGSDDTFVQPKYGQEVANAAQGHAASVNFWRVPGANHDTVPCVDVTSAQSDGSCVGGFSAEYLAKVTALLDAAILP